MQQILIPSDQGDVVYSLAEAYSRLGANVVLGKPNFELELCAADIVHLMWPEEFTNWSVPSDGEIEEITARLDRWRARAGIILTVHNLYPHNFQDNRQFHRLYSTFYERADVIHHMSETSLRLVLEHFPETASCNHVVRVGYNYDRYIPRVPADRQESRSRFGLRKEDIVYLVVGTLRTWDEARLLIRGFSHARVPHRRLLLAARVRQQGPVWRRAVRRLRWNRWSRKNSRVVNIRDHVPDSEMHHLLNAADAVVVVRQESMASGVPSLAMTFGKTVICPNIGAMPEFVACAPNPLYDPLFAKSLAAAIERASEIDRDAIGARNREVAAGWQWDDIVRVCLDALPSRAQRQDLPSGGA